MQKQRSEQRVSVLSHNHTILIKKIIMLIRPASLEDAEVLSHLVHRVVSYFTIHQDGRGAEPFFSSITSTAMAERLQSPQFRYWIAVDIQQEIIGAVGIRDNSHLYHLFVDPQHHQRGYGTQLWMHVKAYALANGNPGVFTVNSSLFAEKMYRQFGFVATAEKQEMHGLAFIPMTLIMAAE